MPELSDFTLWVGWDEQIHCPVVIHETIPGESALYYGPGIPGARTFLWWEKHFGPMRKLEVTNIDGYGKEISA